MRILILFLDNSFGIWNKLYHEGPLKTWCKNSDYFSQNFMYSGKVPKFPWIFLISNSSISLTLSELKRNFSPSSFSEISGKKLLNNVILSLIRASWELILSLILKFVDCR